MKKIELNQILIDKINNCTKCELYKTKNKAVPGEGYLSAKLMMCGEAPGINESETGKPFCGISGQLPTPLKGWGLAFQLYTLFNRVVADTNRLIDNSPLSRMFFAPLQSA